MREGAKTMAEASKPILQKPPGYRDPNTPIPKVPKPQIRKQPLPPSFQPRRKRPSLCRICYCFFCIFLLLLTLLTAAAAGLFYLWFNPKLPIYRLQSIQFPRFNISVTSDGTYLDSHTVVRIEATNPNHKKITFYYDESEVRMTVDNAVDLGSASHPGFSQARQNITALKFGTQVKHLLIDDGEGLKLKGQFRSKSMVIRVEVRTRFGIGVEKLTLGKLAVNVLCGDVTLKQLSAGNTPKCTVNLFKWINIR
ncbi:NDR1/HIN1-like protein 6 [Macadamia integrifolia]|uniref:NDR1/HIN1-like protein 6 n=1 Tax=Macadamia integrifolia TaxID=60698 RepID=UPI001C53382C|nr:NDR1/HIN1-like protein 6 [Macadamia integrifolia]XP_042480468.1 NDR1/HIN1-like protein 6 [Macadamia integrifolia]